MATLGESIVRSQHIRPAEFTRNRRLITEIEQDISRHGGAEDDSPKAAELLRQAREERGIAAESRVLASLRLV